jgi:putative NIF3 family GTP cyclohydrolase 1 type 2
MIGNLESPVEWKEFLTRLKSVMKTGCVRFTEPVNKSVQRIAVCGGSGSFLLSHAMRQGADVFITGDFKYHEFFDADGKIQIADIGHFESEQFTIDLIGEKLKQKFSTFAIRLTEVGTNPINYL